MCGDPDRRPRILGPYCQGRNCAIPAIRSSNLLCDVGACKRALCAARRTRPILTSHPHLKTFRCSRSGSNRATSRLFLWVCSAISVLCCPFPVEYNRAGRNLEAAEIDMLQTQKIFCNTTKPSIFFDEQHNTWLQDPETNATTDRVETGARSRNRAILHHAPQSQSSGNHQVPRCKK